MFATLLSTLAGATPMTVNAAVDSLGGAAKDNMQLGLPIIVGIIVVAIGIAVVMGIGNKAEKHARK